MTGYDVDKVVVMYTLVPILGVTAKPRNTAHLRAPIRHPNHNELTRLLNLDTSPDFGNTPKRPSSHIHRPARPDDLTTPVTPPPRAVVPR
jgi:hypothetical protein